MKPHIILKKNIKCTEIYDRFTRTPHIPLDELALEGSEVPVQLYESSRYSRYYELNLTEYHGSATGQNTSNICQN